MRVIIRDRLESLSLPGRVIQKAVGKDSTVQSAKMTMGFGHYSAASGPMEPHQHAEEICYVLSAEKSWVRFGSSKEQLTEKVDLETGMTLHFAEMEFHVFEYADDGHVDLIFFYGQVDRIRPEEIVRNDA